MIYYRKTRSDTMHNIKSYGTVEVGVHAYLASTLDWSEWSALGPDRFKPATHLTECYVWS